MKAINLVERRLPPFGESDSNLNGALILSLQMQIIAGEREFSSDNRERWFGCPARENKAAGKLVIS